MEELERQWIAQAREGSTAHFARLVTQHQQAVRSFLRRLCGNHAEADDLAQEVFLVVWQQLHRFRTEGNFRAWLMGIAYRTYLSNKRSLLRRLLRNRRAIDDTVQSTPPTADALLDLQRALAELPAEKRAVAALCLGAEWSHSEAAIALDLPLGTVKSHAQRAREYLQQRLSGYAPAVPVENH